MDKTKSLEYKILLLVTKFISFISVVATIVNLSFGLYQSALVTLIATIIYFIVFLLLKSKIGSYIKNSHVVFSFYLYCTFLWFFNDGSTGNTIILFMVTYTVSSFVIQLKNQVFFTICSILIVLSLYVFEYYYPNTILHTYTNRADRFIDLSISAFIVIIMFKQLINIIKVNYNKERRLVELRNIELEKSKAELTESQAFFSKLAENLPVVSFQYKSTRIGKTSFTYISGAVKDIYEVDAEEVYKNIFILYEMISENTLNQFLNEVKTSFNNVTPFKNEHKITTPSGIEKDILIHARPEKLADGSVVWYGYSSDITERKIEEEKLRGSENKFRFISENTSDGIVMLDANGITYASKSYTKLFGYSEEEQKNRTLDGILELIHPDDRDNLFNTVNAAIAKQEQSLIFEFRYLHKNGTYVWRDDTLNFIYDKEGKNTTILIVVRDITEQKKARIELELVKNMLEQTSLIAKVGGWEIDVVKGEIKWSEMIYKIHEVTPDFIPTSDSILGFYEEGISKNKLLESFENALINGINYEVELELITAKNNRIWVKVIGEPVFENGVCVKLFGTIQDITYQKQTDSKLKELALVAAKTSDAVVITDANAKISWVNKAFEEMTEYTLEEVIGKEQKDLLIGENTDMEILEEMMLITNVFEAMNVTILNYTKSRKPIWFDISITPVFNENGVCTNFIDIKKDVTERMEKQKELQALTDITADQNQRLLNFTYIVSHNIRSHSSNLSGLINLIDNTEDNDEKMGLFKMLKTSTNKLEETIQNLNEIISVQNNLNQAKVKVNLYTEIERSFLVVNELILESNIIINNRVDPTANIEVIHAYLDSILLNLITNAIKYKSNERTPTINIYSKVEGNYLVLFVQDNGLGLDLVKYKEKLFGMYKTFHNNANSRGIGLFITKNQIEAMNGKIEVESEVNVGSTFKIYFHL